MSVSLEKLPPELELKAINTIRMLAVDAVQKANSGHPGTPMGFAAPAFTLWREYLRFNPENPEWPDRDRFILSSGHASMLLYSLLSLTGFPLSIEDLKSFRQWGSLTPGHPEYRHTPGIETTTGPLGQGFGNAVGMAVALRYLGARFNRPGMTLLAPRVFVVCGDGDMMEGVTNEAASFAGHQGLSNLVCLYDRNHISIDGSTDLAFTEDTPARFRALGWGVREVADGNDTDEVRRALDWATDPLMALPQERDAPKMIAIRTHIGFGSPTFQDTAHIHGTALGPEEVRKTKDHLGWPETPDFFVPDDVRAIFASMGRKGVALEKTWQGVFAKFCASFGEEGRQFGEAMKGIHQTGLSQRLSPFSPQDKPMATRQAFGNVLQEAVKMQPLLWGGSADLAPSNNTLIKGESDCQIHNPGGKNLHFGVREHAMGAILNGMALTRAIRPYGGTFLVFSDYMKGAMRLSALMKLPVLYVLTHDSIGLGEDGPTHQPIEHLNALRSLPNMTVVRPADANETLSLMDWITRQSDGPVSLVLSRQALPILDVPFSRIQDGAPRGGYILKDAALDPRVVLIGTGSEVSLLWKVQGALEEAGVPTRLVSMPSTTLFDLQPESYRKQVLGDTPLRLFAEAGSTLSFWKYTGSEGIAVGIDHFGASAPYERLMLEFGFSVQSILSRIREHWPTLSLPESA